MVDRDRKLARCKHLMSVLDPHVVCFVCRTNPQREIQKFHGCQSTFDGSIGDPTHCAICSTASAEERRDWFTPDCICELVFTTKFPFVILAPMDARVSLRGWLPPQGCSGTAFR